MDGPALHRTLRLAAADLDPPSTRCPVCRAEGARPEVAVVQRDPDVAFRACSACGACSLSAMPSAAFLERFYRDAYAVAHTGTTARNARRFAAHIVGGLSHFARPGGCLSVLDFGGSDGTIAAAVARSLVASGRASSARVLVVDYVEPAPSADRRVEVRGARSLAEADGRFDLVLASAVLEHIPAVHEVLRGLLDRVGPGGWMYARTPYAVPLKRLLPRYDVNFPAHVHDLGPAFWSRVLTTFGVDGEVALSRPSLVETELADAPARTLAAHLLKLPARLERRLGRAVPRWGLVGGWEVFLRR